MSDAPAVDQSKPTYRYLPSPEKGITNRHVPTAAMPLLGDFVVFSIDPVASVAHLDKTARQAARKIRTHRHVGIIMMMEGLPMDDDPVNAYTFAFLRKGLPPTVPPDSFPELCVPVLPNVYHPTGCEPLRPIHPLPWSDCYISATNDLHTRTLRVTTTPRDYTPILPLEPDERWRLSCFIDDCEAVAEKRMRRIREGSLEAVAAIPLPESPLAAKGVTLPALPTLDDGDALREENGVTVHSSASSYEERLDNSNSADDVSVIGSIDSSSPDGQSALSPDKMDVEFLRDFERFLNNAGSVDDPVVDIWYDLDMVKEVVDISLFLEECAQIRRVIDDAEERLGIRAAREAAAAERKELHARMAEEAKLRSSARDSVQNGGFLRKLSDLLHAALHTVICHSSSAHGDE